MSQDEFGRLDEARTEDRMRKISLGLGARLDGVVFRPLARAEPAKLWEHEPHPVAALPSGPEFSRYSPVGLGLRDDEAVEVEGIHDAARSRG